MIIIEVAGKSYNQFSLFDKSQIIFVGDVHGKFRELDYKIHKQYQIENSVIIICGDFGVGFNNYNYYITEFKKINRHLIENNNYLFAVRGNHDDPSYFNNTNDFGSNISLVKDYTIISVNGYNILCLGGAISIDKSQRILNKSYWLDEKFKLDKELLSTITDINYVASHTICNFAPPKTNFVSLDYPILTHELAKERLDMTEAYEILVSNNKNINKWFYGHFHTDSIYEYNKIDFICLNELSFKSIYLTYKI